METWQRIAYYHTGALLFQQLLPISQNLDGLNVSFDNRKMDQERFYFEVECRFKLG